jgi:Fe-S-cluster containining protein
MEPWYKEGLKFKCTGCGNCCRGKPGYVWVNQTEMENIASFLKLPFDTFKKNHVRKVYKPGEGYLYSLIELGEDNACVFLKDNECSIYDVRPKQCSTFPFWPKHLASKNDWEALKEMCEGINENAPIIPLSRINGSANSN